MLRALGLPTATRPDALLIETARLDPAGRLPARGLFRALGWTPGHHVEIAVTNGLLVIGSAAGGLHTIGSRGQLALPVAARRICGITPGPPVLLAAAFPDDVLVVHPAHTVARLLTNWYTATDGERDDG